MFTKKDYYILNRSYNFRSRHVNFMITTRERASVLCCARPRTSPLASARLPPPSPSHTHKPEKVVQSEGTESIGVPNTADYPRLKLLLHKENPDMVPSAEPWMYTERPGPERRI